MSTARPLKEPNLLVKIRQAIESGAYLDTVHAQQRSVQRRITRPEYIYVLLHGRHEPSKDMYDLQWKAWHYAVRGKTLDGRDLRVVVSFAPDGMLIITVIEVGKP